MQTFFKKITLVTVCILSAVLLLTGCCPPPPKILPPVLLEEMQIVNSHEISMRQNPRGLLTIIPVDYYFETPIAQVKPNRVDALEQMAHTINDYVNIYPSALVYVRGYTDAVYTRNDQLAFSQQYADMITSYLWNAGVPAEKIVSQGYGFVPNKAYLHPIRGKNLNRRVEIDINIHGKN